MLTKITSISNNQIIESFVPLGISVSLDNVFSTRFASLVQSIVIFQKTFFFFFLNFDLSLFIYQSIKNFFIYMIYVLCNYLFNNYSKSFITINYSKIYFFLKNEPMPHRSYIFCYLINIDY